MKRSSIELEIITNIIGGRILFSFAKNGFYLYPNIQGVSKNIAKGTTDLRVEFISQDHSSQFTNLEHITTESQLSINLKISTKHQHLD